MFKSAKEIKEFILWCQKNKVKSFKQDSIAFELSEIAFVNQLTESQMELKTSEAMDETLVDTAKQELDEEEDSLLYWST
jgi:hypothetical protein